MTQENDNKIINPVTTIKCLGFIMDGNRRWAKEQGLPTLEGHRQGLEKFFETIDWVQNVGIENVVYYAFSTENWQRSKEEVTYLMNLFREVIQRLENQLEEKQVKIKVIGRRNDFEVDIIEKINLIEQKSLKNAKAKTTIWIALSYGGRAELVEAINQAIKLGEKIDEETFSQLLWTADLPDADLIVRTSGEQRLSNFLTWRSVYSELLFLEQHWPALTKVDFENILLDYANRERRKGK